MDKKTKKHLDAARKRLQRLQHQLAGARQQTDDPDELKQLENEIAQTEDQIEKLKAE